MAAEPWSDETRFSRVDYRDVAKVAAIALTSDRVLYGTFELCADYFAQRAGAGLIATDCTAPMATSTIRSCRMNQTNEQTLTAAPAKIAHG